MSQINNSRIAKNTILLYMRMLITLTLSLYTSRIIFQALGVSDLGIYNVVGGVIGMLGFFKASLSGSSQRFFSFELGLGNQERLTKTFKTSFLIHCLLALFILILTETIGLYFVNYYLVIPEDRILAANYVYQAAIFSSIIGIVGAPFTASIMAHEKMGIYAYFSILDVVFKLIIVFSLFYINVDKLVLYSFLLAFVAFINVLIPAIYSCRKFEECRLELAWDGRIFKEIFSFTGWNLSNQFLIIINEQTVNIILNLFLGPIVNGAKSIAGQISSVLANFVYNFQTAVRSPIVKSYASAEKKELRNLIFRSSKFSFYLMFILSLPILINTEYVFKLWLGTIPEYAVGFCRLTLIAILIDSMTGPITALLQATGRVKSYLIRLNISILPIIPISYIILKLGLSPYWVLMTNVLSYPVNLYIKVYYMDKYCEIDKIIFFKNVVFPCYSIASLLLIITLILYNLLTKDSFFVFCFFTIICISVSLLFIYILALDTQEKLFFRRKVNNYIKKILKKD